MRVYAPGSDTHLSIDKVAYLIRTYKPEDIPYYLAANIYPGRDLRHTLGPTTKAILIHIMDGELKPS